MAAEAQSPFTDEEHESMLKIIERITALDPDKESPLGLILDAMVTAVDAHERCRYPEFANARKPAGLPPVPLKGEISLPNGCTLYWKLHESVNCREYYSDEIGGGVTVWNTALVQSSTLLAAIVQEERLATLEREHARRKVKTSKPDAAAILAVGVTSLTDGKSIEEVQKQYGVTGGELNAALEEVLRRAATWISFNSAVDTGPISDDI